MNKESLNVFFVLNVVIFLFSPNALEEPYLASESTFSVKDFLLLLWSVESLTFFLRMLKVPPYLTNERIEMTQHLREMWTDVEVDFNKTGC